MAAHQSTTIPRARGMRAHRFTPAPATGGPARQLARRRSYMQSTGPSRSVGASPKRTANARSASFSNDTALDSPQLRAHVLGQMIDGIGFIETACAALENNDKTAFAMPCLHQGISMLRHAHDVLERADAVTLHSSNGRHLRTRRGGRSVA